MRIITCPRCRDKLHAPGADVPAVLCPRCKAFFPAVHADEAPQGNEPALGAIAKEMPEELTPPQASGDPKKLLANVAEDVFFDADGVRTRQIHRTFKWAAGAALVVGIAVLLAVDVWELTLANCGFLLLFSLGGGATVALLVAHVFARVPGPEDDDSSRGDRLLRRLERFEDHEAERREATRLPPPSSLMTPPTIQPKGPPP